MPASLALWRFITDHAGHRLQVASEGDRHLGDGTPIPADILLIELDSVVDVPLDGTGDRYTERAPDDLSTSQYVEGWPEQPTRAHVSGPRTYTTLYPHAPLPTGPGLHGRPTIRPGTPAPATRDRAVHITKYQPAPWLTYLLAHHVEGYWALHSTNPRHRVRSVVASTDRIADTDVYLAQQWAADQLHDDHDADRGFVTEWRPVILEALGCWVPLFDDTDRRILPWTDLIPETGSRHP